MPYQPGDRFERLVVIKRLPDIVQPNGHKKTKYLCRCDCGNVVEVAGTHLQDKHARSCGCLNRELSAQRLAQRDRDRAKHGLYESRLYKIYGGMLLRCYNPNDESYHRYGGRGIYISQEWCNPLNPGSLSVDKFREFYNWSMMNGYADDLTIDRINNDGPYAPWNCRWVAMKDQNNNKSSNHYITMQDGNTYTIGQLSTMYGIDYDHFYRMMAYNNFDINNVLGTVYTPYGPVTTIINKYGNTIPINAIYYVDQYGFPINMNDYQPPALTPALWQMDDKGFVTGPII